MQPCTHFQLLASAGHLSPRPLRGSFEEPGDFGFIPCGSFALSRSREDPTVEMPGLASPLTWTDIALFLKPAALHKAAQHTHALSSVPTALSSP